MQSNMAEVYLKHKKEQVNIKQTQMQLNINLRRGVVLQQTTGYLKGKQQEDFNCFFGSCFSC